MRELHDVTVLKSQNENVSFCVISIRSEGDLRAIRREDRLGVVVVPEGQLVGSAADRWQAEKMPQHCKHKSLTAGRKGYIGGGYLSGFKLQGAIRRRKREGAQDENRNNAVELVSH